MRLVLLALALTLAAPAAADPATEARFKALYTQEWAWRQKQAEIDEDDADGVRARLPRVDAAAQAERLRGWSKARADLAAIPAAQLSPESQVNYAVYAGQLDALIASQRFRDYEMPANSDTSFWSNLAGTGRRSFKTEKDYRAWISAMREVPRYFAEETANMRAGLARGFTPPAVTMTGRDTGVAVIADATDPAATVYYEQFKAMPANIPAAIQAELRAAGLAAIRDAVIPAHRDLLKFLRATYFPGLRATLAAEAMPDGKAWYAAQIREFTTLDLTPDAIHAIGAAEVAKIRAQMLGVMAETGFKGDFAAFLTFLRTDPQFYPRTPAALLERAAWISKRFDGKADRWFGRVPRSRFGIVPVPPEIAPFYTAGRGGTNYLLNTYDLPSRPFYQLTALTLHESDPGIISRARWRRRAATPTSGANPISRPLARAGRCIASCSASRWACTKHPTTASGCSAIRCGAPRGWLSTPACIRKAGRATGRSPTSATTPRSANARSPPRSIAISPGRDRR